MSFRTEISHSRSDLDISHDDQMLCIGSCFAGHIGGRLERLKFPSLVNPFGIVYNPVSVANVLEEIRLGKAFGEAELIENQGLWHSFAHHGRFSHPDRQTALDGINSSLASARKFLGKTNRLLLTLGTANVFVLRKTGEVVANCHKLPGSDFERRRLSVDEVAESLIGILRQLKNDLPALEVIATVSPVRHLRDGLLENQRSKATLLLGLERVSQELPFVRYFPAYELVLDDLRDYRFFDADMAHPNVQAVDYVWRHFTATFFDEKTKVLCLRIEKLVVASEHRPIHPASETHQIFLREQMENLQQLQAEFPHLNFEKERKAFELES